jgi:3-deoxy-D-manno-octulosonate 8-phosphate phosphatase (KDO 8-P phosphatase)
MIKEENFKSAMRRTRAFVIRVEGVLTHDKFQVSDEGTPVYSLSQKDWLALNKAAAAHYFIIFLSSLPPDPICRYLQKNGFSSVHFECINPLLELEKEMIRHQIKQEEIAGIAAIESDSEWMKHCGVLCCTGDAVPPIIEIADYQSPYDGGSGALYDCIRQVMLVQGEW